MKRILTIAAALAVSATAVFGQGFGRGPRVEDPTGYKDTYKDYFTVGVAVNMRNVTTPEQIALIKKNFNSIDYVTIKRNEMLMRVEPLSYKAPSSYTPNHAEYEVTLIFSEDLAVDGIKAYFWADTLYRIHIPNSITKSQEIGEGLIMKYGDGIGYYDKNSNTEDQLHRWGNDNCIATYRGKNTYNLNSQGLASGVASWFHEVEIIKNDLNLMQGIENYLHQADSLWQVDRYKGL